MLCVAKEIADAASSRIFGTTPSVTNGCQDHLLLIYDGGASDSIAVTEEQQSLSDQ
jgi:hypothetical protein